MNVVFLDYDGVVNTPMWDECGKRCRYNFPEDNKVNNFQSVQWVSEFCEKYNYSIVVSSTWRFEKNYYECLRNGGLRAGVCVVGKTPILDGLSRTEEISRYLLEHPEVENFLIFDDDEIDGSLSEHAVLCDSSRGFGLTEFQRAVLIHERIERQKQIRNLGVSI